MTQHKEIQDLLYFKGNIDRYHIKLNSWDKEDNDNVCDLKVVLSVIK